jgi:hypothetical protein
MAFSRAIFTKSKPTGTSVCFFAKRPATQLVNSADEGEFNSYTARFLDDNGLSIVEDEDGRITARPHEKEEESTSSTVISSRPHIKVPVIEQPAQIVPASGFNVVLTHCTADFDSLASAVGLAKLWSKNSDSSNEFDSQSHVPTFVVLPAGPIRRFRNF